MLESEFLVLVWYVVVFGFRDVLLEFYWVFIVRILLLCLRVCFFCSNMVIFKYFMFIFILVIYMFKLLEILVDIIGYNFRVFNIFICE